jgi:hypothetical protein
MMNRLLLLAASVLVVSSAAFAAPGLDDAISGDWLAVAAQEGAPDPVPSGSERMPADGAAPAGGRARMFLVLRLSESLRLNDEQTLRVAAVFRSIQERRRDLIDERARIETKLESELAKKPPSQESLSSLTAEAHEIDRKVALLPDQAFEEVGKDLTVEQRARLVLLKGQLRNQLQNERARRAARLSGGDRRDGAPPSGGPRRRWWRGAQ